MGCVELVERPPAILKPLGKKRVAIVSSGGCREAGASALHLAECARR
jgi:hypothetical protein